MKKIALILLLSLPFLAKSQTNIITTFAGIGLSGDTGDSGLATSAKISGGYGGVFDNMGNYYFSERGRHKVRKVSSSGIIYTVAGNGIMGFSGDSGLAINAQLNNPIGVATDSSGNLYISDLDNNRVRKVDNATGVITTIAGNGTVGYSGDSGLATSAELSGPTGLCIDPVGNIYIGDIGNNVVRKVNTMGIITTYAGTGVGGYSGDSGLATSAKLESIEGICSDKFGNIYIACGENIRKVAAATGIITTVAGNGISGYNGDNISADSAELASPFEITVDAEGNLYIADTHNDRIREVDTAGIIHTVVGNGTGGYNGDHILADSAELNWPEGVSFDPCGNLYINDFLNYRIRKVARPPIITTPTISLSGETSAPTGSTVTVNATVTNAGSSYEIYWMNHGVEFTTTTVPVVTYTKTAGIDTITAKVVPTGYGCWDSTTSSGWVVSDSTTSPQPSPKEREVLRTWPNPVRSSLTVELEKGVGSYRLLSIVGTVLGEGVLHAGGNSIDARALPVGVYVLEVVGSDGEKRVSKIIKQ